MDDGLTIEYVLTEQTSISRSSKTKSGKKTANVKKGTTILWSVTVIGTFTYTGSSSKCTDSDVSYTCPSSSWKIKDSSATKSGATAYASVTAKKYNNGVVTSTKTQSVSLVCAKDGTLY